MQGFGEVDSDRRSSSSKGEGEEEDAHEAAATFFLEEGLLSW